MPKAILSVCRTCKTEPEGDVKGLALAHGLQEALAAAEDIEVRMVECLSNCNNGCSIALTAEGKWQYVYGGMNPEQDVNDLVDLTKAYALSADGLIPWRSRPEAVRRKVVARIPAL